MNSCHVDNCSAEADGVDGKCQHHSVKDIDAANTYMRWLSTITTEDGRFIPGFHRGPQEETDEGFKGGV